MFFWQGCVSTFFLKPYLHCFQFHFLSDYHQSFNCHKVTLLRAFSYLLVSLPYHEKLFLPLLFLTWIQFYICHLRTFFSPHYIPISPCCELDLGSWWREKTSIVDAVVNILVANAEKIIKGDAVMKILTTNKDDEDLGINGRQAKVIPWVLPVTMQKYTLLPGQLILVSWHLGQGHL